MKIMLFPNDRGGGFGHLSRCLSLAGEAERRGHLCGFVLNSDAFREKIPSQFHTFYPSRFLGGYSIYAAIRKIILRQQSTHPLFVVISTIDYQIIRDGLLEEHIVEQAIDHYIEIVGIFKPDVLIGDTDLLAGIVAKRCGLPIIQIVQPAYHPVHGKLLWWDKMPEGLFPPEGNLLFNPVLEKMGMAGINRTQELLCGDLFIIPSIPELDPSPQDAHTFHVGNLSFSQDESAMPSYFQEFDTHRPLLYVTIGGGARQAGSKSFFETLMKALRHEDMQVIISTGTRFQPKDFSDAPRHVRIVQWVTWKYHNT